jgi:hypothetical protein
MKQVIAMVLNEGCLIRYHQDITVDIVV